jgi:hypothetical protein
LYFFKNKIETERAKGVDIEKEYGKSAVMKASLPDEKSDQQVLRGQHVEKKKK